MQLHTMGLNFGVAVGCHSITNIQANYIRGMYPEYIIVAFDESVDEKYLKEQCSKLQFKNSFFSNQVGYIFDRYNIILPKDSKAAPTDYGLETFKYLMNQCLYWL